MSITIKGKEYTYRAKPNNVYFRLYCAGIERLLQSTKTTHERNTAALIYLALFLRADARTRKAWVTILGLALTARVKRNTAAKGLRTLEEYGLIRIKLVGKHHVVTIIDMLQKKTNSSHIKMLKIQQGREGKQDKAREVRNPLL